MIPIIQRCSSIESLKITNNSLSLKLLRQTSQGGFEQYAWQSRIKLCVVTHRRAASLAK